MSRSVVLFLVALFFIVGVAAIAIYSGQSGNSGTSVDADTAPADRVDQGESADYKERLAKYLAEKGMVLYGAYWCSHCKDQKEAFGEAVQYLDYVECDPRGENANPSECEAQGIEGYPTWVYQGQKYSGTRSLSELAQISGFVNESASESRDNNSDSTESVDVSGEAPSDPAP
ncbi:MAG: protein disulfide isomerase family protein [Patescibacteria group bacterium]